MDSFILFFPLIKFQTIMTDLYFTTIILDNSVKEILEGRRSKNREQPQDYLVSIAESGHRNEGREFKRQL